jgi:D-glycero-D-manno-heptose 1,7-bisphosphate phosphatase
LQNVSVVFLDRDGVINENRPSYVHNWGEFSFLPGAREAIAQLSEAGHRIIVCTNQAGIASGEVSLQALEEIHQRMRDEIVRAHGSIECVYYCPHGKQGGCLCRKPQPGLLLRARDELGCDLTDAFFIGDSITDVQAAIRASVLPILVLTGRGTEQLKQHAVSDKNRFFVEKSLLTASEAILHGAYACSLKCVV